jgi:transcriptional regulator with GAF, ATPase, and Fis domain
VAKLADAPDLGLRNHRFQGVPFRSKEQQFYERNSRVFHEIDPNTKGEYKVARSCTNPSTRTRHSSIYPIPAQRLKRLLIIADTNEFSVDKNWFSHESQSNPGVGPAGRISSEQRQIEAALAQTKGKVSGRHGATTLLGMPASTLESKIRTRRIKKHAYKEV